MNCNELLGGNKAADRLAASRWRTSWRRSCLLWHLPSCFIDSFTVWVCILFWLCMDNSQLLPATSACWSLFTCLYLFVMVILRFRSVSASVVVAWLSPTLSLSLSSTLSLSLSLLSAWNVRGAHTPNTPLCGVLLYLFPVTVTAGCYGCHGYRVFCRRHGFSVIHFTVSAELSGDMYCW